MSKVLHMSLSTFEQSSTWDQQCSVCGSAADFGCIDHCQAMLCARCTSKHRADVIQQMHQLLKRLKTYLMKVAESTNTSHKKSDE